MTRFSKTQCGAQHMEALDQVEFQRGQADARRAHGDRRIHTPWPFDREGGALDAIAAGSDGDDVTWQRPASTPSATGRRRRPAPRACRRERPRLPAAPPTPAIAAAPSRSRGRARRERPPSARRSSRSAGCGRCCATGGKARATAVERRCGKPRVIPHAAVPMHIRAPRAIVQRTSRRGSDEVRMTLGRLAQCGSHRATSATVAARLRRHARQTHHSLPRRQCRARRQGRQLRRPARRRRSDRDRAAL